MIYIGPPEWRQSLWRMLGHLEKRMMATNLLRAYDWFQYTITAPD